MVTARSALVGSAVTVTLLAALGTACSGDEGQAGTGGPSASPPAATATSAPGSSGSAAPGPSSSDDTATSGAGAAETTDSVVTAWTDPTLPPANTLPTTADDTIAQAVVGQHGYDVCALIDLGGHAAALVGQVDPQTYSPGTMPELAAAYGHDLRGDDFEGAVSCSVAGPSSPASTTPRATLRVWTDDQLRFTLGDAGVTVAAHAATLRQRFWSGAGSIFDTPAPDLVGIGEGGWSEHDFRTVVFAWQGPILLGFELQGDLPRCSGDEAAVAACQQAATAPVADAFAQLFPLVTAELLSGTGRAAILPPPRSAADTAPIRTATGEVDLCSVTAAAVANVFPELALEPALSKEATEFLGEKRIEGGWRCTIRPVDRDGGPTIEATAYGADVTDGPAVFADRLERYEEEALPGVGEQAMLLFTSVEVIDNGVYFRLTLRQTTASTQYVDYGAQSVAIATAIATAV